jgi:hypothetical protein
VALPSTRHNVLIFNNFLLGRSARARQLFIASVVTCIAVLVLAKNLPPGPAAHLTPIYKLLFTVGDYQASGCSLLILLIAAATPIKFRARRLLLWLGLHPIAVAIATSTVLAVGACWVYQNSRLSMDEYAQFFQSQIFAAGHINGRLPVPLIDWLIPVGFQTHFLDVSKLDGAVVSAYWPSFALLLSPFTRLGIPWACNPILSGATVWMTHRLALRIFANPESAGLATLFMIASPVFFADGVSYYSMTAHLLANVTFALLLTEPTPRRALAAGFVGSVALTLHNPLPHLLFAAPWILYLLLRPDKVRIALSLLTGYLPLCLLLGLGWFFHLSQLSHEGGPLTPGSAALGDSLMRVYRIMTAPTQSALLARLIGIAKIWAWAVPGLVLIAIYGGRQWWGNIHCKLLCASALLTLLMFVIADQGHGWGYRYFHSAWVALPILGAAAFAPRSSQVAKVQPAQNNLALNFVVVAALLTLFAGIGLRAFQMRSFIEAHDRQVPQYPGTERRVVILDTTSAYYGADLVQNDPWLRSDVIRMITHGSAADEQMMRENFSAMHRVYADKYGSVWSAK